MEDTIEKKQFYDEYSSFNLQPGKEIKLGDSLYFREERVDLLPFALESVGFLTAMKDKSAEGEKAIGQELQYRNFIPADAIGNTLPCCPNSIITATGTSC